jgi:hypothetical protein
MVGRICRKNNNKQREEKVQWLQCKGSEEEEEEDEEEEKEEEEKGKEEERE